jgi:hypothetical protein
MEIHTLENGLYVIQNRYFESKGGSLTPAPLPEGVASGSTPAAPTRFLLLSTPTR